MPLTFIVGFAAVFGSAEAIRHTQAKSRREEHRSRKNNLIIHCVKSTRYSPEVENKLVVLSGDKLFADTGEDLDEPFGYPFAGYYLGYPDAPYAGLVSQVMDDPPMMNWIYVDKDTYEVKFGTRPWAEPNLTGPFDCTRQDRRLTFAGFEGFCLVKEGDFWSLYFDLDDDKLKSKVPKGTPVLEVELTRKEIRAPRPIREPVDGGEDKENAVGDKPEAWKLDKPEGFGAATAGDTVVPPPEEQQRSEEPASGANQAPAEATAQPDSAPGEVKKGESQSTEAQQVTEEKKAAAEKAAMGEQVTREKVMDESTEAQKIVDAQKTVETQKTLETQKTVETQKRTEAQKAADEAKATGDGQGKQVETVQAANLQHSIDTKPDPNGPVAVYKTATEPRPHQPTVEDSPEEGDHLDTQRMVQPPDIQETNPANFRS